MMKLIIPTDFTVKSLQVVPAALKAFPGEQLQIILLHIMQVPTNPMDLLMLPRDRKYLSLFTEAYRNEVERIRHQSNGQIESIFTDFLYMGIQRVFHDYVHRHNADAVVMAKHLPFKMPTDYSIDPVSILSKAKVPVLELDCLPETPIKKIGQAPTIDLQAERYKISFG